ncbi:MAG: hypothetical protein ACT4QC_09475 [Planctomycetaceae bacterium]
MQSTSGLAPLGRLFWMMIGPAILFLLALAISRDGGGWFTAKDIGFLAALAGIVLGRFIEFRGGDPRTADGQPATQSHFRRYAALVVSIGLGVWAAANLIGNW